MSLTFEATAPPLEVVDGVVRVVGTRVPLDTVVGTFNEGATAEEIVYKYPTVPLRDVYAVITYYLDNQEAVDAYIAEREERAEQRRKEIEDRNGLVGARARLLARRKNT
jgi:uncharacterized protein (DUF433 family)